MTSTVSVGQFATMTHLSVKTLHHYHDVGLLEPVHVDPATNYRYYSLDQLPTAQLIRRLRDLRMPVPDVRAVLLAHDAGEREELIGAHIDRLEAELVQTTAAVRSLRALLGDATGGRSVYRRAEASQPAVAITETVEPVDIHEWWRGAAAELRDAVRDGGLVQTGPLGGLYDEVLFRQEPGRATLFIPVTAPARAGRTTPIVVPATEVAVVTHHGPPADIDLAYAELGAFLVAEGLVAGAQIREYYHPNEDATDVAWPIVGAGPAESTRHPLTTTEES